MNKEYWIICDYPQIKTSELIREAKILLDGKIYIYNERNIDIQFPAPKEIEISRFKKSIESDIEHKGKSHNDFITESKKYMTLRQYLILFLQVYKTTSEYLDVSGWTRTSDLWSDGYLVMGGWYSDRSGLCLSYGDRDYGHPGAGPRERFSFSLESFSLIEIAGKKYKQGEVEEKLKELKSY